MELNNFKNVKYGKIEFKEEKGKIKKERLLIF
jgi:hypothetical protein